MSRRLQFLLGSLLLLGLGLLGSYLLSIAEPYQEIVKHGPAPEVAANPYLAAEHFLRAQGIEVQHADGLEVLNELPSAGQTLLLLGDRKNISARQNQRLLEWTAKGGHLLVVAEHLWDEDEEESGDLLLDPLGIQQYLAEDLDEEEDDADSDADVDADSDSDADADAEELESEVEASADSEQPASEDQTAAEANRYPELTQLYLENEDAPAYIDFDTDYHLYDSEDRAHVWANSAAATHMLQLYHGQGLISVLTDSFIWNNRNIGDYDNAWLLWYLSQDSAVTLVYRAERDDLFSLLLRNFPEALMALALLIVLTLWSVGVRQGPLQLPVSLSRRKLQEHVRGSADFLLRRCGQQSLLQGLQHDIQRRARRRHPGFERLGVAEQWHVLARMSRLPSSAISQAMRPLPEKSLPAAEFTRQVAHLQTLRNAL